MPTFSQIGKVSKNFNILKALGACNGGTFRGIPWHHVAAWPVCAVVCKVHCVCSRRACRHDSITAQRCSVACIVCHLCSLNAVALRVVAAPLFVSIYSLSLCASHRAHPRYSRNRCQRKLSRTNVFSLRFVMFIFSCPQKMRIVLR